LPRVLAKFHSLLCLHPPSWYGLTLSVVLPS
jgi:hypothetical protein